MNNQLNATFVISSKDNNITVVIDGLFRTVVPNHPFYTRILDALLGNVVMDKETFKSYVSFTPDNIVRQYFNNRVHVMKDKTVLFDGNFVSSQGFNTRLLWMIENGAPPESMFKFLERVSKNPSQSAKDSLFDFLEANNLPITGNGTFLAYKTVRDDYMDVHSGKFRNAVGDEVVMPREQVVEDRDKSCASGLHIGARDYVLNHFGGTRTNRRVMVVEIDPEDVVSVPFDYNCQKMRVCRYKVIDEIIQKEESLPEASTEAKKNEISAQTAIRSLRDPKTGRFIKQSSSSSAVSEKPHNVPLRDERGRFIKKTN